ncbi:MAG: ArnT family glycosyltransferase, partial [Anaerolineae bacterium]
MLKEGRAARSSFYTWGGGLALFLLALIPRALNLGLFLVPDEPRWMNRSIDFLRAILERDWGATSHAVAPGMATPGGVPTKWAGSVGILIGYLGHRLGFGPSMDPPPTAGVNIEGFLTWLEARPQNLLDILVSVRLPIVLLTSLGVVMVYILARKLFNDKVAWLGAALLALDPFYLAHSRVLHTDALAALFMTLSVLSFIVYLDAERHPGLFGISLLPWPVLFSGVMSGLAFTTKSGTLFLVPLVASWTIATYVLRCRSQGRVHLGQALRLALILVVWGGMTGLASVLVWPAMWVDPLGTLQRLFTYSRYLAEAGQTQFFLGRVVSDP